jgi:hypothetical protein
MADHRRDGVLAVVALGSLLLGVVVTGRAAALARPLAVGVGVVGTLTLEVAFLRIDRLAEAWERPAAWAGATLALGGAVLWAGGTLLIAAVCWGLVAYLALLAAVVVAGVNPVAVALARS